MSTPQQQETASARSRPAAPGAPRREFTRWAELGVAYGAVTALLGVFLLVWPAATLLVVVVFLAAQLLVWGVVEIGAAVTGGVASERTLAVLSGVLSLLAGLLVLRKPLQTLLVVTVLIGGWWIVRGVLDLAGALPGGVPGRWWNAVLGLLSLVAGVYVVLQPGLSLRVFVVVSGLWMVAHGAVVVGAALAQRRRRSA